MAVTLGQVESATRCVLYPDTRVCGSASCRLLVREPAQQVYLRTGESVGSQPAGLGPDPSSDPVLDPGPDSVLILVLIRVLIRSCPHLRPRPQTGPRRSRPSPSPITGLCGGLRQRRRWAPTGRRLSGSWGCPTPAHP